MSGSKRTALVTGAAGDIGRGIAHRLAQGAKVFINDRDVEGTHRVVEEIIDAGGEAEAVVGDVSEAEVVDAIFEEIRTKEEGLDILVAQAGIVSLHELLRIPDGMTQTYWQEMVRDDVTLAFTLHGTAEDFHEQIADNLLSTYLTCLAAIPLMKARGGGRIVTMTSAGGGITSHFSPSYGMAKGGVVGLTRSLARRFVNDDIIFNCIAQSFTDAGVWRTAEKSYPEIWERDWLVSGTGDDRTVWATEKNTLPINRLCRVNEVAELTAYLTSPSDRYLVGQTFNVSGGLLVP